MEEQAEKTEDLGEILSLIEAGELQKAQELLDGIGEHGAEWNFVQAELFKKKQWFTESRKQLNIALEKQPDNEKYQKALKELEEMAKKPRPKERKKFKGKPSSDGMQDACAECSLTCCCEFCGSGICELLTGGCG